MKYLFTYSWNCGKEAGTGASDMEAKGTNVITHDMIYGEAGAIKIVTKNLEESGYPNARVCPMGWYKFEEDNVGRWIDKVRAEIELKEKTLTDKYGQQKYGVWTDDVLQIIDKYRAESETQE